MTMESTYNETEMSHLLLERFYGIYFDTQKSDVEVLFKIFPSNPSNGWMNCTKFKETLCSLLREEVDGEFIASSPTTDEIDALIAYYTK